MKQCQSCKETKMFHEFELNNSTRDGYHKECMSCKAKKKGMTEDEYLWYCLQKRSQRKASYTHNKEVEKKTSKKWQQENKERVNKTVSNYRKRNPVITRDQARKRKEIFAAIGIKDFTEAQWLELKEQYNNSCAYCGCSDCELTIDHVVPISKGGQHTKSNIVPACRSCNSKKNNKTPEEAEMKFLSNE